MEWLVGHSHPRAPLATIRVVTAAWLALVGPKHLQLYEGNISHPPRVLSTSERQRHSSVLFPFRHHGLLNSSLQCRDLFLENGDGVIVIMYAMLSKELTLS
ncbi:hypothetical protein E2C01_045932 [Portunus trituberculatus]|uniref:Uncharacterized protein n=1 Tax=Portunus trituberculatus TaxID=210409 RepID=A0A5B7G496_PORTR|nr:hypothetical protein [Portunus trituberculatus]